MRNRLVFLEAGNLQVGHTKFRVLAKDPFSISHKKKFSNTRTQITLDLHQSHNYNQIRNNSSCDFQPLDFNDDHISKVNLLMSFFVFLLNSRRFWVHIVCVYVFISALWFLQPWNSVREPGRPCDVNTSGSSCTTVTPPPGGWLSPVWGP